MANTIYTYHDITQATINQIGVSQARTNATTGDNIFVLNNTKVTSINFISSSAARGYLQVPTGTQINDVLIAYSATGTISSPPQTLGGWKNLSVSAGSVGIFFKIVSTAADTTEMLTSSVNLPNDIIVAIFRPNATINKITTNEYTPTSSAVMQTISYSGSSDTQKKPAIAVSAYRSQFNATQNELIQFSAEVGNGSGSILSMTYLDTVPNINIPPSSHLYAKYKTYNDSPLVDMNVQYNGGQVALAFGSLHLE